MSTTQIAAALYQLQQLDLELERLTAEQQALTNSLQDNPTLKKLRVEYRITQQQLSAGLQAQKEAEWALEDLERRLKSQEQRLYSGVVANAKELHALQQEVQHLRAQRNRQEETALEMMEAAEELQEMMKRKEEELQKAESDWAKANATGELRRDQLEVKQHELLDKRSRFVTTLDSELVKRYDLLRKTKQGRAISKVEQNSCQWCRVILTASELQRVRVSSDLQTCGNCGRILYFDR